MDIWEVLKRETPTRVDEINLALQNCIDTIENTRVLLQDKSNKYADRDNDDKAMELLAVRKELYKIMQHLQNAKGGDISTPQMVEETPINPTTMPIEEAEPDEEEIDDDEKYLVDQTIPYKLSEDFMNTKPCAFELQGTKYAVRNFNELLVKFCEVLYRKNERLFEKIATEHRIKCGENGRVMIFYKQDKVASDVPKNKCTPILSSNILVFTNINNPTKVYAIRELLSIYHISENSFSVYLKWDKRIDRGQRPVGKLLNIDYDYSQEVVVQPKVKPEISVGQLAYDFFKEYFSNTQKYYNLKDFLDETWCKETLGIPCPLFKEYNESRDLKEQTLYRNKTYAHYHQRNRYRINGKTYLICMLWNEGYRDKLEAWINEQDSTYLDRLYSKKKLNNEETVVVNAHSEKSDAEKRIGEYARDYFEVYFSQKGKQYDLKNFLNKYWCNEHLGICYPLLKEVDLSIPIADQKNYNNEYARYWIKPVLQINGKHYIMCSQWFKGFQEKLDKWIEEETLREATEFKQQRLFPKTYKRNKKDCIHYDFKKNQCMCTQSNATFTMPCSNINSCQYFMPFALHIIPKQYCKKRHCPYCNGSLEKELVYCTYRPDDETEIHNKLISYRCEKCDINYVADTVYKGYTHSKNLEDLNVTFIKEDIE